MVASNNGNELCGRCKVRQAEYHLESNCLYQGKFLYLEDTFLCRECYEQLIKFMNGRRLCSGKHQDAYTGVVFWVWDNDKHAYVARPYSGEDGSQK